MPKVVSRSAVSSSTDAQPTASSAASLRVYYCICGEFILVIDKRLAALPRRKTDNSIVIRSQNTSEGRARVFKFNAIAESPVLLERNGGHEKQYRFHCPRCSLKIGYQSSPPPVKSAPFLYIFAGALTQIQGQTTCQSGCVRVDREAILEKFVSRDTGYLKNKKMNGSDTVVEKYTHYERLRQNPVLTDLKLQCICCPEEKGWKKE